MARKKKHEEHGNHEAWAIPYADLMTLLLAFFVVMYAISSLNEGKYRVLADALTAAFGGAPRTINPVQVGNHQLQGSDYDRPSPIKSGARQGPAAPSPAPNPTLLPSLASHLRTGVPVDVSDRAAVQRAQQQLGSIATRLEEALAPLVDARLITVRRAELWLEVEINSDILFDTGSAALDASAREVLTRLADVLRDTPNPVRVEGYTDDRPINTFQFPSNWELSAARAASVVHLFSASGVAPERLAMVGYGEHRPRADNLTEEGRNRNRRVVLIVLAAPGAVGDGGADVDEGAAVKSKAALPIGKVAASARVPDRAAPGGVPAGTASHGAVADRTTGGSD
ncbi:flagellar motor protein MotD [Pseudoxanthomonas suwonensis]|uniref:flagellar motor protein MotD n=1 Tax=Pseudoxanthomonas suwonensis TaxID=314722 RepID=UPI00138F9591|nr:flagellar motor protein MotD [Pseudoxanthomonas suwonensis]KAF1699038.1 flagellar motor protein MotD [Pseudoxanthomonas suwonensis]